MRDAVLVSSHVVFAVSLTPSHARPVSLWWSLYKMWPAFWAPGDEGKKHTFHMLPISFEWLFPLVKVPVLSNSHSVLTFLHFSLFYFIIFHYKNGPYSRSPGHFSCSCAQNYHNSYKHSPTPSPRVLPRPPLPLPFLFLRQIHFRMNDAENKNRNPQKSRTCTLSQNLLPGVKPVSLCEANEQASFFKAALMHESELVNCETTPSESGLEQTAVTGTPCAYTYSHTHAHAHTHRHTDRNPIWNNFCGSSTGEGEVREWVRGARREATCVRGRRHAPAQTGDAHNCWSRFSLTSISFFVPFCFSLFFFS